MHSTHDGMKALPVFSFVLGILLVACGTPPVRTAKQTSIAREPEKPEPVARARLLFEDYAVALSEACLTVDCSRDRDRAETLDDAVRAAQQEQKSVSFPNDRVRQSDVSAMAATANFPLKTLIMEGIDRVAHLIAPQLLGASGRADASKRLKDLPRLASIADAQHLRALLDSFTDATAAERAKEYEEAKQFPFGRNWPLSRKPNEHDYAAFALVVLSRGIAHALELYCPPPESKEEIDWACDEPQSLTLAFYGIVIDPLTTAAKGGFHDGESLAVAVFRELLATASPPRRGP